MHFTCLLHGLQARGESATVPSLSRSLGLDHLQGLGRGSGKALLLEHYVGEKGEERAQMLSLC